MSGEKLEARMRWLSIAGAVLAAYVSWCWLTSSRFDPGSLKGKRVVLTGASVGIGEQMAYHYARMGAKLLITARRDYRLQEVIDKCREVGDKDGEYYYVAADMGNITSSELLIEEAVKKLGGIDYLVLNHILPHALGVWTGSESNMTLLENIFDVNFKAYVHLASHALPYLEASHGSIVVVSSLAGRIPQPYVIAYSSSKFALDGFFSGLRQELWIRGVPISVTLCVIGLVGTESAITQLERFGLHYLLDTLKPAEPTDAALAIISGGALRQREVYFPYWEAKSTILRDIIPETYAMINRLMYRRT